jgi:hypothetical protein
MAKREGFFHRVGRFLGLVRQPEPKPEPRREPEPIIRSRETPSVFAPLPQHHTWRDIELQASINATDGNTHPATDLQEAFDRLSAHYGSDQEARDKLYEILNRQSKAFDSYAIDLDPSPGHDLWDEIESLGLPASLGNYHGNTVTGISHFYGNSRRFR